jgi:cyclopropane fatty-acyl-phospholipid synthase-like methyltransferase
MTSVPLRHHIRRHYDENQVLYDVFWSDSASLSMNYGFWRPDTRRLGEALANQQREMAERLQVGPGDCVLDAGCGVGGTAVYVAREHGAHAVGITLSPVQAARARRNAADRGVSHRASFLVADFTRASLTPGSFAAVYASESACHAESKQDFADEAFRLLEPGGRLVVADGFLKRHALGPEDSRLYAEWCRGWVLPNLATVEGFGATLRRAGFAEVSFADRTREVLPSSRRIRRIARITGPAIRLLHRVGLLPASQVDHVVACLCQHALFARGVTAYGIFTARKPARALARTAG